MVSQYRPPNVLLQEGSAYKADIDSSLTSVGRIAAAYLAHEKPEIAEVSKITLIDDVSGNLDGTYFFLFTPTVDFYIWFNATDISGLLDPGLSGATGIRIDFVTDDLAATIAATMNAIIDAQALLNSFVSGDEVTISNRDDGAVTDISDGLSGNATGFSFLVLIQGGDGPTDLSIHIDAGYVLNDSDLSGNNGLEEIAAQTIEEGSGGILAPSVNPRIDRIVVDIATGVAELVGGAEAASPVAPDVPEGKAPNCQFRLEVSSTILTDTLITDERVFTIYGLASFSSIKTDQIDELTAAAGVIIEGVLLKDSQVDTDQINEKTSDAGVLIDNVLLKDNGIQTDSGGTDELLRTKVIEIGDWDMNADGSTTVTHGLTLANIRLVTAFIRRDDNLSYFSFINYDAAGVANSNIQTLATFVQLTRAASGQFDNTNFDSTSFNRGWVTILYAA